MLKKPETKMKKTIFNMFTGNTKFDNLVDKLWEDANKPHKPLWKTTFKKFNDVIVENGIMYLALPGYAKKDINIDIQGRMLIVSADIEEGDANPFRTSFKRKNILKYFLFSKIIVRFAIYLKLII